MLVCFGEVKPMLSMLLIQKWFLESHMSNNALVVKRVMHCPFKKVVFQGFVELACNITKRSAVVFLNDSYQTPYISRTKFWRVSRFFNILVVPFSQNI
jgi:hypothetical protein